MKSTMSKVHAQAMLVAAALAQRLGFEVSSVRHVDVKWAAFTGIKAQRGFRVRLVDAPNLNKVSVTLRRPRGGMLCDVVVEPGAIKRRVGDTTQRGWTQVGKGDVICTDYVVRDVLAAMKQEGWR